MSFNPYNNPNTIESDRRSNVSSFYRGRKDSFDALNSSGSPVPAQSPQFQGRDSPGPPSMTKRDDDGRSSFFGVDAGSTRAGSIAERYSRTSTELLNQGQGRPSLTSPTYPEQTKSSRESYFPHNADNGGTYNSYNNDSVRHGTRQSISSGTPLVHSPPGEGEDQGWDVFNDFNNLGPRYSDAFGGGIRSLNSGYSKLPPQTPSIRKVESDAGLPEGVELVTVPALGPDWKKSEIEGMRSATHRAQRWEARKNVMTQFWRDQRKFCGLSRKILAFTLFGLCCLIGIALAITLPRVPGFAFNAVNPLSNDTHSSSPPQFSRIPANFTFHALLNIQVNTQSNIIPMHINSLHANVYDLNTDVLVGQGDIPRGGVTIAAKQFKDISVPVSFTYVATNDSDQTWLDFYKACQNANVAPNGVRPGFNLRVVILSKIAGLLKTVTASTQIDKVACPFQLPESAA